VAYDSGGSCGLEDRTIWYRQRIGTGWSKAAYLRSYYFEDVNQPAMRNFCQKFATNQQYREVCLAEETDWAVRNTLFERNNAALVGIPASIAKAHREIGDAHQTWIYIKRHWQAIIADPEYQRIAACDGSFTPSRDELDPEIQPAVAAFNQIAGVETQFSCQGVTATVAYNGYDILVVSPHQRFADIHFKCLPTDIAEQLQRMASQRGLASLHGLILYSTGDNPAFRMEAIRLAGELQPGYRMAQGPKAT
jgi:hypothetical protein